jgi:NADPH:quinone reductase-like Zn-dependent oxidoreductase
MKAITRKRYGGPEVLHLQEVEKPALKDDYIMVRVYANSANPVDWHIIRGKPLLGRFTFGILKPAIKIPGADFSGVVQETGKNVSRFKAGDHVFGEAFKGAFAEYTCVPENVCAAMPAGTDFPEMACVPIAGLTALQALITHGNLKAGEYVLINGSSGGVGHFAVQIARAYGAIVTAVCSGKNVEFVKTLGADRVIAYDKENIHEHNGQYDLIVDTHGNLDFKDFKSLGQRGVITGFTTMGHMISVLSGKAFSKFPLIQFTAKNNTRDLETLASLIHNKKIRVHIDKIYPSNEIPEAIGYIEAMRTKGKVAIIWNEDKPAKTTPGA